MIQWIQNHPAVIWCLAVSVITFVGTLVAIPILVARIPADYFVYKQRRPTPWAKQHEIVRWTLRTTKNSLGVIFVLMGIAMLVLPGQGVLTILVGIMLIDFPGKYRFQRWLVMRRPVLRSINWLRQRAGRKPLVLDD